MGAGASPPPPVARFTVAIATIAWCSRRPSNAVRGPSRCSTSCPLATGHPISYVSLSDTRARSPFAVISRSASTTATWCPGSSARQTTRSEPSLVRTRSCSAAPCRTTAKRSRPSVSSSSPQARWPVSRSATVRLIFPTLQLETRRRRWRAPSSFGGSGPPAALTRGLGETRSCDR
jgi:hypothetical protein